MSGSVGPSLVVAIRLGCIAAHAEELLSPDGHDFDVAAIRGLLADPEVSAYLEVLRDNALLPVARASEGEADG